MNIKSLQQLLSRIDEITIIGKVAEVDGVLCHVMGVARYGMEMRLLVLQYDETYEQRARERDAQDLCDNMNMPQSNRILQSSRGKIDFHDPLRAVRKIFIGESEFEVHGSEHRKLGFQDCEAILILSEFLRHGWLPEGIDSQNIDMLYLSSLELHGDYSTIPAFGEKPKLHFTMGNDSVTYLVEQPITLTVGDEYPNKLRFQAGNSSEGHWAQINRVYLLDMWAEMGKVFDDPKINDQMTPEQLAQAKSKLDEQLLTICPRGMYLPVVEYECEEGISLSFYLKAYLDAIPVKRSNRSSNNSCSSIGFILKPDQQTGSLGLKLKAAVIQQPVPGDTVSIEAELFQYFHTTTGNDIVLK